MFNQHSETHQQHTIGGHYHHAPAALGASSSAGAKRHLEMGPSSEYSVGGGPSDGSTPVKMANASTNTPRRPLATSAMAMASASMVPTNTLDSRGHGIIAGQTAVVMQGQQRHQQQQQQQQQHHLAQSYTGPHNQAPQLAAVPKKRGPKVGSRRTKTVSALGASSLGGDAMKPQPYEQSSSAIQSGWQHDPLPALVATCNKRDERQVDGGNFSGQQQHDPYAFHCDSAGGTGAPGGRGCLDNATTSLDRGPRTSSSERRQSRKQFANSQQDSGSVLRQQQSQVRQSHALDANDIGRHLFDDNRQQDLSSFQQGNNDTSTRTIATNNNNQQQHQHQRPIRQQQQQQLCNQEQSVVRMIAHHQKQAAHHQTQVQMQSIHQQQPRNPAASSSTITNTTTNHHQQHHHQVPPSAQLGNQHHAQQQPRVVVHHHQPAPLSSGPVLADAPLNHSHPQQQQQQQQQPPNLHLNHQQANSEQQQFNANNYYNGNNNEPHYEPIEVVHQQPGSSQMYIQQQQQQQQRTGDGQVAAPNMVPTHPQARFAPGATPAQYQATQAAPSLPRNHLVHHGASSVPPPPPPQAYMATGPTHSPQHLHHHQQQQQQQQQQQHTSFQPAGPIAADQMPTSQQTIAQVPRASHMPPHPHPHQHPQQHHHHQQQQQQSSVVDGINRPMQQHRVVTGQQGLPAQQQAYGIGGGGGGQQHIPVRPSATAHDSRLADGHHQHVQHHHHQNHTQQQRHQIPIRPGTQGDHFGGDPSLQAADPYSMGPTNLLQQQLNRRPGPPPSMSLQQQQQQQQSPVHMQRQPPATGVKQPPRSSFQPTPTSSSSSHMLNNELYQPQFVQQIGPQRVIHQQQPVAQQSAAPCKPMRPQQQAIRQQVINQAPVQMDNANHHHHHQQQQHLLCNPTPPLTPNAIPPMVTSQQLHPQHNNNNSHHHQRAQQQQQQHPDEWQSQSHHINHQHHHQQQHSSISSGSSNLEPISEQPHLPLQPTGASFSNGPVQLVQPPEMVHQQQQQQQHKPHQHQMRPTQLMGPYHHSATNSMATTQASSHHRHQETTSHHFQMGTNSAADTVTGGGYQQQQQQGQDGCLISPTAAQTIGQNAQQPLTGHTIDSNPNQHQLVKVPRLTLPLRDGSLLGPFKLEHGAQYVRKVFHIKPQLMESLSKSSVLASQQQAAAVVQELQFRAYLTNNVGGTTTTTATKSLGSGDSLLAPPHHHQQQQSPNTTNKTCHWPELFQVSINQQPVHLERAQMKTTPGGGQQHKAVNVFQYCQLGDNLIEFQVNDCYCSHEFILELVDRPTLKAFTDSCFKSRLLPHDSCLARIKSNFGAPGFVPNKLAPECSQLLQSAGIQNDYVSEFIQQQQPNGQQLEQQVSRARISLRCPLSARRMRAPARGPNCKHLQCFDLENFLHANRHQIQWSCPICSLPVPFNMLELDQFQLTILQSMSSHLDTDEVLVDPVGQWQAYYGSASNASLLTHQAQPQRTGFLHDTQTPLAMQHTPNNNQTPLVAKTNGTFHPQISANQHHSPLQAPQSLGASPMSSPMRPLSSNGPRQVASPANGHQQANCWSQEQQDSMSSGQHRISPVRRPPSAISGRATTPTGRPSGPLAKRAYSSTTQRSPVQQQHQSGPAGNQSPHQAQLIVASQPPAPASNYFNAALSDSNNNNNNNGEELSPLAAMERAIIQHEQQMGPPPFDPNSLTSSPLRSSNPPAGNPNQQQQSTPTQTGVQQSQSVASPSRPGNNQQSSVPASPLAVHSQQNSRQSPQLGITQTTNISMPATPLVHHIAPETPATPGSNQPAVQQQQQQQSTGTNSAFAQLVTGSSNSNSATPFSQGGVDHQPLSNGSASAGSITSSSTMTPSGQSLGSVGMGGDSRCNTAPLQGAPSGSLDGDLMNANALDGIGGGNHASSMGQQQQQQQLNLDGGHQRHHLSQHNQIHQQQFGNNEQQSNQNHHHHHHQPDLMLDTFDDKNEILMSKLMMDSDPDSVLHRNNELAMALEEAQWKQQLDRGKSEHLANFLNDPLMMSQSSRKHHHHHHHRTDDHYQHHQSSQLDGANKMLSGGLNPSDDESDNNSPHNSSPTGATEETLRHGQHHGQPASGAGPLEQPLDSFGANYLDSGSVDDGAGLPPDDSILDLFER